MPSSQIPLAFEIELQPGEKLSLPSDIVEGVGPGHYLVTIKPVDPTTPVQGIRDHSAFLSSYAPEDEGLYDDCAAR